MTDLTYLTGPYPTDHETLCRFDLCGHVDTEVTGIHQHAHMTPMDWTDLVDAIRHAFGIIPERECFACYSAREAAEPESTG